MGTETQPTTVVDRELPPVLESVPVARELVVRSVPPVLRDSAALVVSELVANGVKHGAGPVHVRVDAGSDAVRITVHDAGGLRVGRSDGYGLHIVRRLSRSVHVDQGPHGTTVTAVLDAATHVR